MIDLLLATTLLIGHPHHHHGAADLLRRDPCRRWRYCDSCYEECVEDHRHELREAALEILDAVDGRYEPHHHRRSHRRKRKQADAQIVREANWWR